MELISYIFIVFISLCLVLRFCHILFLEPKTLLLKLRKQGIRGPPPSLLWGNNSEIIKIKSANPIPRSLSVSLDCCSFVFPHLKQWTRKYGKTFAFSLGRVQLLCVTDPELVKEINQCTSLDLGKPSYLQEERGFLLGKGLTTTNHVLWAKRRKIIAPNLYMDKVKEKINLVVECADALVKSWKGKVNSEDGMAEIKVDDYVRKFTCNIFSKILFGRNGLKDEKLFSKCRALIMASASPTIVNGLPFYRYLPTKQNKEQWRLAKYIDSTLMDAAKKNNESAEQNLICILMEAAKNGECPPEQFIVESCKDLYVTAFEVIGLATIWGFMLLAAHPEWQARARAEVLQVCSGNVNLLDSDKLEKMKVLKMIVQEVLRLYPPVAFVSREALQDVKLGKLHVPKRVNIWVLILELHRDPELWGPNANEFNPGRFANGISGACKSPQAYAPFGLGARICPGQNLSMVEMRVLFAVVLAEFSLSLSPNYRHVPHFGLLLEPKHGVDLLVRKI